MARSWKSWIGILVAAALLYLVFGRREGLETGKRVTCPGGRPAKRNPVTGASEC